MSRECEGLLKSKDKNLNKSKNGRLRSHCMNNNCEKAFLEGGKERALHKHVSVHEEM